MHAAHHSSPRVMSSLASQMFVTASSPTPPARLHPIQPDPRYQEYPTRRDVADDSGHVIAVVMSRATGATNKPNRQRSNPFLNLTFTSLNQGKSAPSASQRQASASWSKHVEPSDDNSHPAQRGARNHSRNATIDVPSASGGSSARRSHMTSGSTAVPGPSSRVRTQSLGNADLDPMKEYFFTPGAVPTVVSPLTSPSARPRKKSARSAPSTPLIGRSPAGSLTNLAAMAATPERGSLGLYGHYTNPQSGSSEDESSRVLVTRSSKNISQRPSHVRARASEDSLHGRELILTPLQDSLDNADPGSDRDTVSQLGFNLIIG